MDNWSKQFFKVNVLHLSLTLFTFIPSSLSLQQNKMLCWQKEKKFLNYQCFFFGRTPCRWVTFPVWSREGGKVVAAAQVVCLDYGWAVGLSSGEKCISIWCARSTAPAAAVLQQQQPRAEAGVAGGSPGFCFKQGRCNLCVIQKKKKKGKTTPDTSPFHLNLVLDFVPCWLLADKGMFSRERL